jgi:hypothetical protein
MSRPHIAVNIRRELPFLLLVNFTRSPTEKLRSLVLVSWLRAYFTASMIDVS